ncbi:hypothetical protein A2858_03420 [Candidatus Daviesbacteria bacterium RIFCSPHIGHO2_01_FULL_36_37]|uniref:SCP domain-containing protein n=3 Tax=Candidatus Daviesiibacteriota TaxID=1752718 RepID=A0A0G0HBY5_9BACT|nr:MAG: hypothetical protein US19_C0012G0023 [Candidatus Daviesbacteria bacterium GW2011_GWB1_36_5]KKQ16435.1 MAG: hypothetical protein US28_C0001G0025 [Candidatus Daviesbacteria bacterium GW2011_GWA1_36_8]OGE17768.1 MAG: hypothetical protein A2858_03420 [Candidatus Daviesbacteria bacterium RIFCSPHIGHO2_01_FULL_36_37]
MKLRHFFLPHPDTHKKAHLLSIQALVIYIFLFISLQFSLSWVSTNVPGVLGIATNISQQEVIRLTNIEREKNGLGSVVENSKLNSAAEEKAKNMFEENYWAHYSPSGKDPWGFFSRAGYKFSYAGENLARNFYNSEDVMSAWMASQSHRDNILNKNYKEIGIAVVNGVLDGVETTLVVQEFGTPVEAIAQAPTPATPQVAGVPTAENVPQVSLSINPIQREVAVAGQRQIQTNALVDPYQTLKIFGFSILGFLMFLLIVDLYVIKRRGILRLSSHHLPHMAAISVAAGCLYNLEPGTILDGVSIFLY